MADALVHVPFHGTTLLTVLVSGNPHVSVRSLCDALGVDFNSQRHRIARHAALKPAAVITTAVAADGKSRELLTIPLSMLNGWLFGISASRVRPQLRERLIRYQRECFDVLARHFGLLPARAEIVESVPQAAPSVATRLLVTVGAGSQATADTLAPDAVVGTWDQIAARMRELANAPEALPAAMPLPTAMRLAEAASLLAFRATSAMQPGPGAEIASAIRAAKDRLSLADLQAIASAAAGESWARSAAAAQSARSGQRAATARITEAIRG